MPLTVEKRPGEHSAQALAPGAGLKRPDGHALHCAELVTLANRPGAHSVQALWPVPEANWPNEHALHADWPVVSVK